MNKENYDRYTTTKHLQNNGWQVQNTNHIQFHHGQETNQHYLTKCQAAWHLAEQNYRVNAEVENTYSGHIADIVAWKTASDCFVVECETSPTKQTVERKLEAFYRGEPFRECYILNCSSLPENRGEQLQWVRDEIGEL